MNTYFNQLHDLFGLTEEDYDNAFLDFGNEFLKQYNQGGELGVSCLNNPEFWAWWKREWNLIDQVFTGTWKYVREDVRPSLRETWYRRHDPRSIQSALDRGVLDAGYKIMNEKKQIA